MTKSFTFLQLFSLTDGRLTTGIDDVYDMLNHLTGQSLFAHSLPAAFDTLKAANPPWFVELKDKLAEIKKEAGTDDFVTLVRLITEKYNTTHDIPQLSDADQKFVSEHADDIMEGKKVVIIQA